MSDYLLPFTLVILIGIGGGLVLAALLIGKPELAIVIILAALVGWLWKGKST